MPKTIEINLADMTKEELLQTLADNNANRIELFTILFSLFEMFDASLKASSTVVEYGAGQYPNFLTEFAKAIAERQGVDAKPLLAILRKQQKTSASTSLH